MAGSIVCKCGPAFTQNLFTILGILLVLALVLRFFSKSLFPELWGKLSTAGNEAIDAVGLSGPGAQEEGEGGPEQEGQEGPEQEGEEGPEQEGPEEQVGAEGFY